MIHREGGLIDQFAYECLTDLIGEDKITEYHGYSRSYYTLEGHYSNLWNFDQKILPKPIDTDLNEAIQYVREVFRLEKPITSIPWHRLDLVPFVPNTSAGWGYKGKKGDKGNQEEAIRRAVSSLNWWLEGPRSQRGPFRYHPDLAWTRTQLGSYENPKIRHVWGQAFENILIEGMTAAPLIEAYRQRGKPIVVGINMYRRLPLIIQGVLNPNNSPDDLRIGVGLDVKSFDASVQPWLINESFEILRQNIIFTGYMEEAAFEYSKYFYVHRPVVMPDGRMWIKHIGVPSGSYFTQLIGSIANAIVCAYAQKKIYGQFFDTWVLGDDSLFGIPRSFGFPDLYEFEKHFKELNFTLSPNKCIVSCRPEELEFLGHGARGCRVTRDEVKVLRMVLYPEHPVMGPSMSMSRIVGSLLDSALTDWSILHLYRYMKSKYRMLYKEEYTQFSHDDKDWLVSVVGVDEPPSLIDELRVFTAT